MSAEPIVTIGLDETAPSHTFVGVRWAILSGDSLVIVGDPEARRVAAFSMDGAFRRQLGRVGEGPGEYRLPIDGGLTPVGNIWVFDIGQMRVVVFKPDGAPLETIKIEGDPMSATVLGVDGEEGVWVRSVRHFWAPDAPPRQYLPGERYRPQVSIRRFRRGEPPRLVWEGEGGEHVVESNGGSLGSASRPLAPRLLTALLDDVLVMTRTESSSIERLTLGGEPTPWIDYPAARTPVRDEHLPLLTGPHRYAVFPEALVFLPGSPGSAWLTLFNPNDVFHPLVRLDSSGVVEFLDPGRVLFSPLFVGENAAVTKNLSDLGVQFLTVHELIRKKPSPTRTPPATLPR